MAALMLLIVVAALGVFAVNSGVSQQGSVDTALLSVRADAAARSGLEYGSARAMGNNCAATTLALGGFTIRVTCTPLANQVFDLQSTAASGIYGSPDFVQRTLTRRVRSPTIG